MLSTTMPPVLVQASPSAVPERPAAEDDAALAGRAAAGDVAAFEALYRRHHRRVHGAIVRLVGQTGTRAEDLTQETFVRAWRALAGFRREAAFGTWLHRLAVNTALMELRAGRARPWHEDDDSALERLPAGGGGRLQLAMDLATAVASLPPRARAVLVLFDIEGWSHEEIAASLGIAIGSSKAQLHRARSLLRARIGEDE